MRDSSAHWSPPGQHASVLDALGGRIASGALAVGAGADPRGHRRRVRRLAQRRPGGDPGPGVDGHGRLPPPGRDHHPAPAPLERLRPAGDPLAPRRGRPHRAAAPALRAAPRHRAGGRRAGRRAGQPPPLPDPGRGGLRHGGAAGARATSTPTCWPTRLPPGAARGQRQRDAAGARGGGRGGPLRAHPPRHDAGAARTPRRSRCTTRWPAPSGSATPPARSGRCARSSRRPRPRCGRSRSSQSRAARRYCSGQSTPSPTGTPSSWAARSGQCGSRSSARASSTTSAEPSGERPPRPASAR